MTQSSQPNHSAVNTQSFLSTDIDDARRTYKHYIESAYNDDLPLVSEDEFINICAKQMNTIKSFLLLRKPTNPSNQSSTVDFVLGFYLQCPIDLQIGQGNQKKLIFPEIDIRLVTEEFPNAEILSIPICFFVKDRPGYSCFILFISEMLNYLHAKPKTLLIFKRSHKLTNPIIANAKERAASKGRTVNTYEIQTDFVGLSLAPASPTDLF